MSGYPLFLKLEGVPCLVFGGGKVAFRKIQALLKRGARVRCISKDFCRPLKKLAARASLRAPRSGAKQSLPCRQAGLRLLRRASGAPRNDDWNGARLVVAATSERDFNARVARVSRKKKIWVNVVDEPGLCDFYVPAVVERGPLQVAISTDGASPLFAKRLREELEKVIPVSTGKLLEKLGKIRRKTFR